MYETSVGVVQTGVTDAWRGGFFPLPQDQRAVPPCLRHTDGVAIRSESERQAVDKTELQDDGLLGREEGGDEVLLRRKIDCSVLIERNSPFLQLRETQMFIKTLCFKKRRAW